METLPLLLADDKRGSRFKKGNRNSSTTTTTISTTDAYDYIELRTAATHVYKIPPKVGSRGGWLRFAGGPPPPSNRNTTVTGRVNLGWMFVEPKKRNCKPITLSVNTSSTTSSSSSARMHFTSSRGFHKERERESAHSAPT